MKQRVTRRIALLLAAVAGLVAVSVTPAQAKAAPVRTVTVVDQSVHIRPADWWWGP